MPVLRVKNTISCEVVRNLDVQPNSRNQKNYNEVRFNNPFKIKIVRMTTDLMAVLGVLQEPW